MYEYDAAQEALSLAELPKSERQDGEISSGYRPGYILRRLPDC